MIGGLAAMLLAAILFPLCKEEEREPGEQHGGALLRRAFLADARLLAGVHTAQV